VDGASASYPLGVWGACPLLVHQPTGISFKGSSSYLGKEQVETFGMSKMFICNVA
jgi:hypothetical protein